MLKVLFGDTLPGTIIGVDGYFDNVYEYEWFEGDGDPYIKQMVRDIDKSDLIGMNVISDALGSISIRDLSGGVKSLIMMYKMDDFVTDLIVFGNNCEGYIMDISSKKDIKVSCTGTEMIFEGKDVIAECLNDGSIIHGWCEWVDKMLEFMG